MLEAPTAAKIFQAVGADCDMRLWCSHVPFCLPGFACVSVWNMLDRLRVLWCVITTLNVFFLFP